MSDLTQILEREWTRKDVQRIWSEAPADRYDAIKDAHNSDNAALVKALRRAIEHFDNFHSRHADTEKTVSDITAILNQGRKDADLGEKGGQP